MLLSFTVQNFRSFSEEQLFSLIASKGFPSNHPEHLVPLPSGGQHALRAGVIYGANGAGKSSLFKALQFLKQLCLRNRPLGAGTGRKPFIFSESLSEPTVLDLQFLADDVVFRYFVKLNDTVIVEEFLTRNSRGREVLIYERITNDDKEVIVRAPGVKNSAKIKSLATVGAPPNATFLATVSSVIPDKEIIGYLSSVLEWFSETLRLIGPDQNIGPVGHMLSSDSDFLRFAGDFLRDSSTGVASLIVDKVEMTEEEVRKIFPSDVIAEIFSDLEVHPSVILESPLGAEYLFENDDGYKYSKITIKAEHLCSAGLKHLMLNDESDGTKRLLQLLPSIHQAAKNSVYFVDEIDRSLHPMLIWKFIEAFVMSCENSQSQLVVTTHESNLLDLDLFRRDEIWFAEKDQNLATQLYSLADFKVREDLEVRKHYLNGRFGAVPFLGNIKNLIDQCGE